jgi:hypothetical protein
MADTWTIKFNNRTYGPYSVDQMKEYVAEGRVAAHSLVSRTGHETLRPASEDPELAPLFRPAVAPARPAFFTAENDQGRATFGKLEKEGASEWSHFFIVADMKSRSISGIEEEIYNCGPAYAVMPQAWLVSSEMSINAIRNALVQKLGRLDVLFILDATHNKAAWFNYGPEADSRIRRIWQKTQEQIAGSA